MPLDFPNSPTNGQIFTSGIKKWQWSDAKGSWLASNTTSAPSSFRNKLINAQGLINQRVYVSGTATTQANQYTVDRWRVVTSGQNLAFSETDNVVTFTAPAGGVEQVVEDLNVESGTYVLNWNGTATATVNGSARTKGQTFSLTGGSNTTVRFSGGTFSLPQLEKSTVSTDFEHRPIGTELALCQRYYEKSYNIDAAPGAPLTNGSIFGVSATTGGPYVFCSYKVVKRLNQPAVSVYSPNTGTINRIVRSSDTTDQIATVSHSASSGFSAGNASTTNNGIAYHFTADAEL